jgi:hypothetical protein
MKEYPLKQLQNEENHAPEVSKQMLGDIGINPFAVELLNESLRCHPDFEEITEKGHFDSLIEVF